jgi:hypothetical protein
VRRFAPLLLLFFLSPTIGELVSGSAPPREFFAPGALLLLASLYGSGAILIREFAVRWGKGWPTIFTLGCAYGILEEGLMVKSFFDPNWMDLGLLGKYGRWAGVNWVWSLDLMIYHSVVSIAIPIFLVEHIFPERKHDSWLGSRGRFFFFALVLAVTLLGYFQLTPYRPPALQYLLAISCMLGLISLAKRMPATWLTNHSGAVKDPFWFGMVGFGAFVCYYFLLYIFPVTRIPVWLTIGATLLALGSVFGIVHALSGNGAWIEKHQLGLVSGVLAFFAILAPLQELDETRVDDATGMMWVGVALAVFLFWLWRRGVREEKSGDIEVAGSG